MRKVVLLFFFIVLTIQIKAQEYVPIAVEGAQWVIYQEHTDPDGLPPYDYYPPFNDFYFGYRIEGDITINGIDYKKVYRRNFLPVYPNTDDFVTTPLYIDDEYLFGAIRDDMPNRKVYGIKFCNTDYYNYPNLCNCDEEVLLYDFTMNLNDSYSDNCMFIGGDEYHIGELLYQTIEGENRLVQRIYESYTNLETSTGIYEGIGSSYGLFEKLCYFECNPKTFLTHYCVGTDEECLQDYLLATNEYQIDTKISVYPNPSKDFINIDLKDKINTKIQIFNIYGKEVFNAKFEQDYISINISNFTKGVYILKINNQTVKLIKQ